MKKIIYMMLLLPLASMAQVQNYIKTITQRDSANTATQQVNITYFDGLGRPTQKVQGKMGADGKDIITHIEYDGFGRQVREYLPYVSTSGTAQAFEANAKDATEAYYSDNLKVDETTLNPWSEKFLEASPLGRVLKQAAPGNAWVADPDPYNTNDKTVKFVQMANSVADAVKKFSASTNSSYVPTFTDLGSNYLAGELYKTVTKDENWKIADNNNNTVQEFKNREGQIVLKRTFDANVAHDTYYVYDQFGNLTYVLPPLMNGSNANIDNLGYQYKYDSRNRLVEKKLPGKQWEYIVYDTLDRVVATGPAFHPFGDGNTGWMITKYDAFSRVAYTGWIAESEIDSAKRKTMQGRAYQVVTKTISPVYINNIPVNYTNVGYPTEGMIFLTANYYDNYVFPTAANVPGSVEEQTVPANVKGLPTGSWTRILTNPSSQYLLMEVTTIFYDAKGRAIRTRVYNSQSGGYTQTDSKLDFAGKTLYTVTRHKRYGTTGDPELMIRNDFAYSEQDRLLSHTHKINTLDAQPLATNTYEKLGQLKRKMVGSYASLGGSGALQWVDYKYNVRGWLTDINNVYPTSIIGAPTDLFGFKIAYNDVNDDPETGLTTQALFNGNISETYWRTNSDYQVRKYSYKYDNLNRLTNAYYQKPGESPVYTQSYNEAATYDMNGNILTMSRNGGLDDPTTVVGIDELVYTYPAGSNQLSKVYDNSNSPQGFKDNYSPNTDYTYDANGNMLTDLNKGITSNIKYNHLNLPVEINFGGSNKIVYLYDAVGQKLKKTVTEVVSGTTTTVNVDYVDGFQYKGGVLQFFPTAEGYVDNTVNSSGNNVYNYVYQYKDHLGNVRLSYTAVPGRNGGAPSVVIKEENHYYPFGLKHLNYNVDYEEYQNIDDDIFLYPPLNNNKLLNNYKYNGKELQDELGLNMYDYGWRQYDPALGRFNKIDRFAEKYHQLTPYGYAANNPVYFVDVQGDSLRVANTQITKDYLNDVVRNKNQQYLKYDDNGNVSLDFGDMSEKDIAKTLKRDEGLSAINDLVNSKDKDGKSENYYLEVSNKREGILYGKKFELDFTKLSGTTTGSNDNRFMLSLSTTSRGDGLPDILPANGYDGVLYISPGTMFNYDPFDKKEMPVPSGGLMLHEIRELYERTHGKLSYPEAHKKAGGQGTYTSYKFD